MTQLNMLGEKLGQLKGVTAMTDVTGFGLLGHLIEIAEGAGLSAEINYSKVPMIDDLNFYISQMCVPDNSFRNWSSYDPKFLALPETLCSHFAILRQMAVY